MEAQAEAVPHIGWRVCMDKYVQKRSEKSTQLLYMWPDVFREFVQTCVHIVLIGSIP